QQLARISAPLSEAYTLPTSAYTSEVVYAREVQRFLGDVWHPVARVEQVANPGDYLSLDLLGQPLLIVRDRDSQVRVMSRVCLHRSAPLIDGCGNRNKFTCPYHAWTYDLTGQLKSAPLMNGAADFSAEQLQLPQAAVEIWQGFVMANFAAQPTPFAPQVETFSHFIAPFNFADMRIAKTLTYQHDWNWKVLVDNFMEAYHHIAVHNKTFEPNFHARDSKIPDNDGPWSILHMPAAHPGTREDKASQLEEWQLDDLFANVVFPMFLLGVQGTSLVWYQVLPEGPHSLELRIHICLPADWRQLADYADIVAGAAAMVDGVHQEDIAANDLVWSGLTAPLTQQGRLSPLERSIWQFNQWWLDQLGLREVL
ncbi:MAG: aromatic ring-hydroxylating dioxygenase subunit alpha, partial [Pseudomonadota bacterium]